jgi:SAM-dependent methyltransferase
MTTYELKRIALEPFFPALYGRVRADLKKIISQSGQAPLSIIDVGGRNSHYTVLLPINLTVMDIPRENEVQEQLNLGMTDSILAKLRVKRSNIENVVLEDMTKSTLPSEGFDGAISIEVIEHVPDDATFVQQISRILKPGGWLYLTTPNGDYIKNKPPNYNPDHIRHYTRQQLHDLLSEHFSEVSVFYGIKTGKYRLWGLKGFSLKHPFSTIKSMFGNLISRIESKGLENKSQRTAHLFAIAYRSSNG